MADKQTLLVNNADASGNSPVDLPRLERLLKNGQIVETRAILRWGSNYAALVTIRDSELQAIAVYKPQRGERPLWDFPDGTLCYREVLSYTVSQALDWQLVPPTVLRDGPHGIGSFQIFIAHDPDQNYFSLNENYLGQLQQYAIFDYLINNADRKGGHLLLDANRKLWGIDHGLTFHTMPKLRTVIWDFAGQRIDSNLLVSVQKLRETLESAHSELRCQFEELLSHNELVAFSRRAKQLLDCQKYPSPGAGPNYPWPPV